MLSVFNNLRLMSKVLFLYAVFFLTLVLVSAVGVGSMTQIKRGGDEIFENNLTTLLNLTAAQEALMRLSVLQKSHIISQSDVSMREMESEMQTAQDEAGYYIELFMQSRASQVDDELIVSYLAQFFEVIRINNEVLLLSSENNDSEADALSEELYHSNFQNLMTLYGNLLIRERDVANNKTIENELIYNRYLYGFIISAILVVLIFIYSLFIIQRSVMLPLLDINRTIKSLAASDLDVELAHTDRNDEIGDIAGALQVLRTDKMEADRRLAVRLHARAEMSDSALRSVFALVPIGIVLSRPADGAFVDVNPALRDIFQDSAGALTGHEALNTLLDPGGHLPEGADWDADGHGSFGPLECAARTQSGAGIVVQMQGLRLTGEAGEALLLTVIQDVTIQRAHEKTLRDERDRADEANRAKSRFLANMTHEIRTPMNGVLGLITRLLKTGLDEEQTRVADLARQTGVKLLGVLEDLLDFSVIESGVLEVERRAFDIGQTVRDCVELHRSNAASSGLRLELDIPANLAPRYLGDSGKIEQIVSNLVGNALKFTETGSVSVGLAITAVSPTRHQVSIRVVDTGIGMTAEQQARVFDRFVQADESTKRAYGGVGLGLSIVHGLAELLGGAIDVHSEPGAGSSFTFSLGLDIAGPVGLQG